MRIDDNSIRVDRSKCVACGICVDRCIMDNLRLSIAPCRQACPVNMNCQGYIRLIASGREEQALEHLRPFGPLAMLIADACSAPCEKACARRKKAGRKEARKKEEGAVHILELKRYLVKKYPDHLNEIEAPAKKTNKKIAIIGAGVPGLAGAVKAVQSGHKVQIFEKLSDKEVQDDLLKPIAVSLERAGVCFSRDAIHQAGLDSHSFDAVVVSQPDDVRFINDRTEKENSKPDFNAQTHFLYDHLFCCENPDNAKNSPVHQISSAFETVESVNRYLNGEPMDWGRGFYTQDGAVKAYTADQRIGSDVRRTAKEDLKDGLDEKTAVEQASRCFSCGRSFEKNQTCWYCLPCELECPHDALEVRIPYLVR